MPILTPEERLGLTVAGKYELDRVLGSGGMGVVFEAHHKWTGRKVALKMLHPGAAANPKVVHRFLREAKASTQLRHPAVVDVLDMGQDEDGSVYLTLELLEGEPLSSLLEREGLLSAERTVRILMPILDALAEAHERGIVHRDLKPDNIFVAHGPTGELTPKVVDFGIAKVLESARRTHDTDTGTVLGTLYYMSPEQAAGAETVGPPADVWSMGVVLYECLTGVLPYDGPSPTAILLDIVRGQHRPIRDLLPELPDALGAVIEASLLRNLEKRPADMHELADRLHRVALDLGYELPPRVSLAELARLPTRSMDSSEDAFAPTLESDSHKDTHPEKEPVRQANTGATPPPAARRWGIGLALAVATVALLGVAFVLNPDEPDESPSAASSAASAPPSEEAEPATPVEDPATPETREPAEGAEDALAEEAPVAAPAVVQPAAQPEPELEPTPAPRRPRPRRPESEDEPATDQPSDVPSGMLGWEGI